MIRLYATALFGLLSIALLGVVANHWQPGGDGDARAVPSVAAPEADGGDGSGAMMLARDRTGQFHVDGAVNGEETTFLVDTGADVVALSPEEAERLGVAFDRASFAPIMQTASGTARGVVTTIDRLEVAGRELDNVQVAVVDGLGQNLLGQSALRRLGRVSMKGDKLLIGG